MIRQTRILAYRGKSHTCARAAAGEINFLREVSMRSLPRTVPHPFPLSPNGGRRGGGSPSPPQRIYFRCRLCVLPLCLHPQKNKKNATFTASGVKSIELGSFSFSQPVSKQLTLKFTSQRLVVQHLLVDGKQLAAN